MLSSPLIPVGTVAAGQETVSLGPAEAETAPGRGAQVALMALISRVRMLGAVSADGQDRRVGEWSSMTL